MWSWVCFCGVGVVEVFGLDLSFLGISWVLGEGVGVVRSGGWGFGFGFWCFFVCFG